MKIISYFLTATLFISCNQRPSTSEVAETKDTAVNEGNADIEEVKKINSLEDIKSAYSAVLKKVDSGTMDSVSFKYNCHDEKSGVITCFFDNGDLRMLKHSYNEYSHNEATDQYFVKDSVLFFVFRKQLSWSFDSNSPEEGGTKDNITEKRFYLIDGQPVKCMEKHYVNYSYAKENKASAATVNKETSCSSIASVQEGYNKLLDYVRNKKEDCLEDVK